MTKRASLVAAGHGQNDFEGFPSDSVAFGVPELLLYTIKHV